MSIRKECFVGVGVGIGKMNSNGGLENLGRFGWLRVERLGCAARCRMEGFACQAEWWREFVDEDEAENGQGQGGESERGGLSTQMRTMPTMR